MKGVAVKTLFLVVVIGMIIFFSLIIFWHWFNFQFVEATRATCSIKYSNYCQRWYTDKKEPGDWDDVPPKPEVCKTIEGLEDFSKPDAEACKQLLGMWYE